MEQAREIGPVGRPRRVHYHGPMPQGLAHITRSPSILGGRATIRGTRISVAHVVNLVANGMTPAQVTADLLDLDLEDVRQALLYAARVARDAR